MTNLERRALLGDAEAQRECTEKGTVLGCPFCGGEVHMRCFRSYGWKQYEVSCKQCFISFGKALYTEQEALNQWNTRPAPPIGRCKECSNWDKNTGECEAAADIEVAYHKYTEPDFFCGDYEPKGGEEDV